MTTESELIDYADRILMEEELLDYIQHHGVRGQKWGVRKARGDRSAFMKKKKPDQPDISKLSDQELRNMVSRMQLEKQFKDLSKQSNKTFTGHGAKFASDILKDVGKQHARKLIVEGVGVASVAAAMAWKMSKA